MICEKKQRALVDYVEGILSDRKRRAIERHLSSCESCRQELQQIRRLQGQLRALEVPEPDAGSWERFEAELSRKLVERMPVAIRRTAWRPALQFFGAGAAAAFALVIVTILLVFKGLPHMPSPSEGKTVEQARLQESSGEGILTDDGTLLLANLSDEEIDDLASGAALFPEDEVADTQELLALDIIGSDTGFYDDLDSLTSDEYEELLDQLESS